VKTGLSYGVWFLLGLIAIGLTTLIFHGCWRCCKCDKTELRLLGTPNFKCIPCCCFKQNTDEEDENFQRMEEGEDMAVVGD